MRAYGRDPGSSRPSERASTQVGVGTEHTVRHGERSWAVTRVMFGLVRRSTCNRVVAEPPPTVLDHLRTVGRPFGKPSGTPGGVGLRWRRSRKGLVFSTDRGPFSANNYTHLPFAAVDVRVHEHPLGSEVSATFRSTRMAAILRAVVAVWFGAVVATFLAEQQWAIAALSAVVVVLAGRTWPSDRRWYERRRHEAEDWLRPVMFALSNVGSPATPSHDPFLEEIVRSPKRPRPGSDRPL